LQVGSSSAQRQEINPAPEPLCRHVTIGTTRQKMNAEFWLQLKDLFHAALEQRPEERRRFLESACHGDLGLRAKVEQLIASHEEAGSFLNNAAVVDAGMIPSQEPEQEEKEECVGRQIGPYEIVREIGQGGMGTVFLAVRADDQYRKHVAIKLVNRGMNTDAILRRFMMERQILANLEHPNIAALLEGGTTGDGLPYFVMEYVAGRPIDEYCDTHRFTTTQRLELFSEVCAALQYAHQNLVIHRDIKPGNILVTGDGVPKLLDFGIAKLLTPNWATDAGEPTLTMQQLMTPAYASPEQLRGLRITTASDVYSLGVVLYELLSGHRPYSAGSRNAEDIVRAILSDDPVRPSIAITHTAEIASPEATAPYANTPQIIGQLREGTIDRLRRRLSGDLDNIVLKALRKEPSRRYASVQELAEDIRRHLAGLPVNASPDTLSYRATKFVQRNRAAVSAVAVIFITLCLATGLTAWQARVARRERDKAQSRFNQVRKLANKVLFEYNDGIEKLDGSIPVREKMVEDASEYLDALTQEAGGDRSLQSELARAYTRLGDIQGGTGQANIGDREGAIKSYRQALAISNSLLTPNPDKALLLDIAALDGRLYQTLWKMGQQVEAEQHFHASLTLRERLVAGDPSNLTYGLALARSYRDFGGLLASKTKRDVDGAIAYYRRSNELCASLIKSDPGNLEARAIAGLGYRMLGGEFETRNDALQALDCYHRALWLTQEREKLDPTNPQIQVVLADCYSNIGRALMLQRDEVGAIENFNRALVVFSGRFARDQTNALLLMNLSQTYNNLGNVMAQAGRFDDALSNYRLALSLRENYVSSHPRESGFRPRLGETSFDLGDLYVQMASDARTPAGKKPAFWREAKSWYQRSLEIWQDLSKDGTLPGYVSEKPDQTTKSLALCDAALAKAAGR